MTFTIEPISSSFGARVHGINLSLPLADDEFEAIHTALDRYLVLVFPSQSTLSGEEQTAFGARFGPLDPSYLTTVRKDLAAKTKHVSYGEVSNVDSEGKIWTGDSRRRLFFLANQLWHTDTSYKVIPTKVTLLWAKEVTSTGGETEFADMCAAWDALSPQMKSKVAGLKAWHSLFHSRGLTGFTDFSDEERSSFPPVLHPIARIHSSGRTCLYLSAHASHIEGMAYEEGNRLLQELTEHATQPRFVLSHRWNPGDLVIWDDAATVHRGRPYDEFKERRVLHRTSANERGPLVAAGAA